MNNRRMSVLTVFIAGVLAVSSPLTATGASASAASRPGVESMATAAPLVTGLEGASGSAIGPGGALYVTEGAAGRISRVDPQTGELSTFASGLPKAIIGIGGAIDVAFIGKTAYALVTLVDGQFGGADKVGIYRVDGPNSFTVVADIGAFSRSNPPKGFPFFVETGLQYALETYRGGFLVTDGHHNRVLRVTLDGQVTELIAFGDIVPTGLAVSGNTVYMAEAGPLPHLPKDGKVVSFGPRSPAVSEVASGARLLVDVEFGRGRRLYALSQGHWSGGPRCGFSGAAEHRPARESQRGRHLHCGGGRPEPADLARVHREHRVRGHPQRGDLED